MYALSCFLFYWVSFCLSIPSDDTKCWLECGAPGSLVHFLSVSSCSFRFTSCCSQFYTWALPWIATAPTTADLVMTNSASPSRTYVFFSVLCFLTFFFWVFYVTSWTILFSVIYLVVLIFWLVSLHLSKSLITMDSIPKIFTNLQIDYGLKLREFKLEKRV